MRNNVTRIAAVLLACSTWFAVQNAHAFFEDDEARRHILDLREKKADKTSLIELQSQNDALKQYVAHHKGDVTPAFYLAQAFYGFDYDELNAMLDPTAAYYGNKLMERPKMQLKALEKRRPGLMFTDLEMQDMSGKTVKLSQWVGKGNYVLVDFWASWCGPCRQEVPNLKKYYEELKDKGVEFLSVSIDQKKEAWTKALKEEAMPWKQGWTTDSGKEAMNTYQFSGIPFILLIDKDSNIYVSKNIANDFDILDESFKLNIVE